MGKVDNVFLGTLNDQKLSGRDYLIIAGCADRGNWLICFISPNGRKTKCNLSISGLSLMGGTETCVASNLVKLTLKMDNALYVSMSPVLG